MSSITRPPRARPPEAVSTAARVADLGSRGRAAGPLEEALGRLCWLAADLLEVPAVLVALKDEDRPFLGGSFGLDDANPDRWWGATPLSLAISDLANPDSASLMVEDLAARELLANDPLLQEHGFRALLAVPLRPGPSNFGSLCALSRHPLAWGDRDVKRMRAIAESVVTEIQLRGSARLVRTQSDEHRARREKLLAETQRLARIGSWEWDIGTDEITWSDELHRIFGTDPETFDPTFDAYLARLPEADRERAQQVVGAALSEPGHFEFTHQVVRPDGEIRLIQSQGHTVVGADGKPERMFGIAQDVTEVAKARERERELEREQIARAEAEASQARIGAIFDSITDAFVAVDPELCIRYVNHAGERVLGGTAGELIGRPLATALPQGAEAAVDACHRALASGELVELEAHLDRSDTWVDLRVFPSGEGLSLYLFDATDRRRAEELMRASEARYRFLADSVPQQIWTADPQGNLDYVNRVVTEYFGVEREATLGTGWVAYVHPDDLETVAERWTRSVSTGTPYEAEFRLRGHDGSYRWHLTRAIAQVDGESRVVKWYGTNTDIHDQKELETARDQAVDDLERVTHLLSSERTNLEMQARELRRFARALKKSNEDLDRFAYVASHDLKAPLRGIANLTSWLVEDIGDKLTDETRQYANLLQNRVQRMESLIDGILQYSRAGRTREEPEMIDIGQLVREVVELLDPPEKFTIELGPYWPVLRTERTPLQQVFLNLIGNAIKHADVERPVIQVRMRDEGADFCEFCVSDNGPGIAPEYHERIFTIFQTLRARDEVEGTGIGLSVVKRTVENQGGQVWVESEVGQGASFSFLWPRDPDAKERTLG